MAKTTVFRNNKTQAVRIPKALELPEGVTTVEIIDLGRARLIVPAGETWDSFFDGPGVTEDFMASREQPPAQEREEL